MMRAVIQRVHSASVSVGESVVGAIERGLLVFLGVTHEDGAEDIEWLANKIVKLRVFEDAQGRMQSDVGSVGGGVLLVSQFTLFGNIKKGTRPSFNRSASPEIAVPIYEEFHLKLEELLGACVPTGKFGAMMTIDVSNDGPVTLILDSKERTF